MHGLAYDSKKYLCMYPDVNTVLDVVLKTPVERIVEVNGLSETVS